MKRWLTYLASAVWFAQSAMPALAAEEEMLRVLLTGLSQTGALSLTPAEITIAVLQNIGQLDANLRLADDRDKLTLYYRGRLVKSLRKPQDEYDVAQWTEAGGALLDTAYAKSTEAKKHSFEAADLLLAPAVKHFGEDSKYYAGVPDDETRTTHRRNFAARLEDDILVLKIGAFNNFSKDEITTALADNPQAEAIVLDLRASPGGQLGAAVEIADLFLNEGIILSTSGKDKNNLTYYNAADGDISDGRPIVALVDGQTASAAEVLAAALQEQSRAKVVGTQTFGKGTIQTLLKLPGGGTVAVSSAWFYTPSGRRLAGEGVMPDVCTFEQPDNTDAASLIARKTNEDCGREERSDSSLELTVARKLLDK